jgi:adenylate cyclase
LQQQYEQAMAEGERAIALNPNNADSHIAQAEVLNLAGRPKEALRAVEQAMRLNPHYPPVYLFELGFAYRLTGRYAEAIAALKKALDRNPHLMTAHLELALSYLLQWVAQQNLEGQTLEPAVVAVRRGLTLNDSLHWGHIFLGYIFLYQQQYEQALAEMARAVALAPAEPMSYAALAEVLSHMGKSEKALEAVAQALGLKSFFADGYLNSVGSTYYLTGRTDEAISPLTQYLTRYPNRLDVHLTLAAVYGELGKDAEAQAEVAEVLRINPKFSLEVHKERVPIKDPAALERHIAALRKAGLK